VASDEHRLPRDLASSPGSSFPPTRKASSHRHSGWAARSVSTRTPYGEKPRHMQGFSSAHRTERPFTGPTYSAASRLPHRASPPAVHYHAALVLRNVLGFSATGRRHAWPPDNLVAACLPKVQGGYRGLVLLNPS